VTSVISEIVDIQRIRQYFNSAQVARSVLQGVRDDAGLLHQVRRGLFPLPVDRSPEPEDPFPAWQARPRAAWQDHRVAVVATGGSGALACVVGVARALEEAGVRPAAYGLCSGSALFGVPLAAGLSADETARFALRLRPRDYVEPDWAGLVTMPLRLGRGWSGLLRGDRLERTYQDLLGDVTLGELSVPVWLPVWNIETNRLHYLGPDTHPDLTAARAVRMAVALPLGMEAIPLDGGWWLDGGIVDILPAQPFVDDDRCDVAIVVNGFYPPGFDSPREPDWRDHRFSIMRVTSQTRLMQHLRIARRSLDDLRASVDEVVLVEPVPYESVQGAGLYTQFFDTRDWGAFMAKGYRETGRLLSDREGGTAAEARRTAARHRHVSSPSGSHRSSA
jgi:NTE family protein